MGQAQPSGEHIFINEHHLIQELFMKCPMMVRKNFLANGSSNLTTLTTAIRRSEHQLLEEGKWRKLKTKCTIELGVELGDPHHSPTQLWGISQPQKSF